MLEKSCSLLLNQLRDHVAENCPDCIESFVRGAYIIQTMIIKEDFLHNEDCDSLAQLRASLHDAKAQGDDLSRKEEIDNIRGIVLDQGSNHSQRGQSQIFERSGLRGSV